MKATKKLTIFDNCQVNQTPTIIMIPHCSSSARHAQQLKVICKTTTFTLCSSYTPDDHVLILLLQIPNEAANQVNIYEAEIEATSQIGQLLGNLTDLVDYLEETRNFRVNSEDGSISLISRTELKGKEKQIQICKIQTSLKQVIRVGQQNGNDWSKNLQQIQQICNNPQMAENQIKKCISTMARFLLQIQPMMDQYRERRWEQSSIEPIINKIVHLGKQQQMMKDKIATCNDHINEIQQQSKKISDLIGSNQNYIKNLGKTVEQLEFVQSKISDRFEKELADGLLEVKEFFHRKFQDVLEQIDFFKKQFRESRVDKSMKQLDKPASYSFSSSLKHKSIRLLSPRSIQGTDGIRSKICLITPCLNPIRKEKSQIQDQSIELKILNDSSDILVGVCNLDRARALNYAIESWGSGNHGGYYINSGGYLYSCYRKEDNDVLKSFTFRDGDIIQIVVSEADKKITFRNGMNECKLDYDENIRPEKLYFCVILHKNSSVAEIIS